MSMSMGSASSPLLESPPRTGHKIFESPLFWIVIVVVAFAIPLGLSLNRPRIAPPPALGQMPRSFSYTDPNGDAMSYENSLNGIVDVISFVDLECGAPCSATMDRLMRLQKSLKGAGPTVRVVSITTHPERDTVEKNSAWTKNLKLSPRLWTLARGDVAQTKQVAAGLGLLASAQVSQAELDELARKGSLAVIDQVGQIRVRELVLDERAQNEIVRDIAVLINTNPPAPTAPKL